MKVFKGSEFICGECGFKSIFMEVLLFHLIFKHKIKLTKNNIKIAIRYSIFSRFIFRIMACFEFVIKIICFPFWWIYENLE